MGLLGLGCLDVQPRPLPIKLALGWSEVAPAQDQRSGPQGALHVVDNLKPPFLERQVSLCPRLIVIEGHEGGHSACSEDGRVRRPGPGCRGEPCTLGCEVPSLPARGLLSFTETVGFCACPVSMCLAHL